MCISITRNLALSGHASTELSDGAYITRAPEATLVTDALTHAEPALPTLPAAGGTLVDPTFGTTIMRLTGPADGDDCRVQYSYWPTFNLDNTIAIVNSTIGGGEKMYLIEFDPWTFTRGNGRQWDVATGGGAHWGIRVDDASWSGKDAHLLFGTPNDAQILAAQNVVTGKNFDLKDLTSELPASGKLRQMSKSDDDNVFAWHILDSGDQPYGYIVWKRDADSVFKQSDAGVDEVRVDRSGRYLLVTHSDQSAVVWDLIAGTSTAIAFTQADQGFVHAAPGKGSLITQYWINAGGPDRAIGYRQLWTPKAPVKLLEFSATGQGMHFSMIAEQSWGLVSTYSTTGAPAANPYENEILQVKTDGTLKVRRLAHHRSIYNDYNDEPHATGGGAFVTFQSNWGNASGRRDVFVVKTMV